MKFVVCEAGVAFHSLEDATWIISQAQQAKANAVKFQLYSETQIMQAPEKWHKHLKSIQLDQKKAQQLFDWGKKIGVEVFFTPMYVGAVGICESVGVKRYKIRWNDRYNQDLIFKTVQTGKPFYISRASTKEYDPVKQHNAHTIFVDTQRPTKINRLLDGYSNLLKSDGYSCHCPKLLAPIIAMQFPQVNYIECHISLDPRDKTLPDWQYSFGFADIYELCRIRDRINNTLHKSTKGKLALD